LLLCGFPRWYEVFFLPQKYEVPINMLHLYTSRRVEKRGVKVSQGSWLVKETQLDTVK
jgi:hypothetical protein